MPEETPQLPPSPVPVPQAAQKRRGWIIAAGIILTVVLLGGISAGAYFLLRSSAELEEVPLQTPDTLPEDQNSVAPDDSAPAAETTPAAQSSLIASNIAFTITYSTTPQFQFNIENIAYTEEEVRGLYQPAPGAPYSILRLLDASGQILNERQFAVSTQGIVEGPDIEPQIVSVNEGSIILVMDSRGGLPATAQIVNPLGQVLDEQPVDLEPLPAPEQTSALPRLWHTLRAFFTDSVLAQSSSQFTIVVIGDLGVDNNTVQQVRGQTLGLRSIEPWATFASRLNVVTAQSTQDLGCIGSGNISTCTNDAIADNIASATAPGWDAIIIVSNLGCADCGFVGTGFPPIVAVGTGASTRLIVHELGHAVGKMVDEYGYQSGGFAILPNAPNCFDNQLQCTQAIQPFAGQPGGQCSLGCDGTNRWRPASRIMHNTYSPLAFGPLEECLMYNAIASAIGEEQRSCTDAGEEEGIYDQVFSLPGSGAGGGTGPSDTFTIVVMNEVGAGDQLDRIANRTEAVLSLNPWNEFQGVRVVPVENTQALGCRLTNHITGKPLPLCENESTIRQIATNAAGNWNTIIVIHPFDCNCGSLKNEDAVITAVGSGATQGIVAHMLGHTVGKLQDENWYEFGNTQPRSGDNCFASLDECRAALAAADNTGAECSEGCYTTTEWRPTSRIMHHTYQPFEYGPVDACLVGRKVAEALGTQYNCPAPDPANSFGESR